MVVSQVSLENYINQSIKLGCRERKIFYALEKLGEATSWDLLEYFGWNNPNMVRPRLSDLESKGLILKLGKINVNGIKQFVWGVKK